MKSENQELIWQKLSKGDDEGVMAHLDQDPSLANDQSTSGWTLFMWACYFGLRGTVDKCLEEPIFSILDYAHYDRSFRNALIVAEAGNNHEIAKILEPLYEYDHILKLKREDEERYINRYKPENNEPV